MEKSARNLILKLRVLLELGFMPASVFPAFLPRFLGSSCVLVLGLKVWIFATSLLWMGRPNSLQILRYFGLSPNPSSAGNPAPVVFFAAFLAPCWTVLRDSTWGLILTSRRTTFMFWARRDSSFVGVKIAIYSGFKIPPKTESRRGRRPRIPSFSRIAFCPPTFWNFCN